MHHLIHNAVQKSCKIQTMLQNHDFPANKSIEIVDMDNPQIE